MSVNYKILIGDNRETLKQLPDKSVHCVVSSPSYYKLRDYGNDLQIGLEETPQEYIEQIVNVFAECHRILKDDGTLWLNLGDSYNSASSNQNGRSDKSSTINSVPYYSNAGEGMERKKLIKSIKPKDLMGIPWRVAFALQEFGWYLRCDIIWSKPNPMPESVTDRPTKSHEYIFLLSKSERYYYDHEAIKEPAKYFGLTGQDETGYKNAKDFNGKHSDKQRGHRKRHAGFNERWDKMKKEEQCSGMRNKRSVWNVATHPYKGAHFATFPPNLIRPCILAGCPIGGTILDPFGGSGTTGMVSLSEGRNAIMCELNPEYAKLIQKRCDPVISSPKIFY